MRATAFFILIMFAAHCARSPRKDGGEAPPRPSADGTAAQVGSPSSTEPKVGTGTKEDEKTRGIVTTVNFPTKGSFVPGVSDPLEIPNHQGHRIFCLKVANLRLEPEAKTHCPMQCQGLANQGQWTGYWRGQDPSGAELGVCECIQKRPVVTPLGLSESAQP